MLKYIIYFLSICCIQAQSRQLLDYWTQIAQEQPVISVPSVIYLISENFEGTGLPSGWTGSGDFDYTTSPMEGSQSFRTTSGAISAQANYSALTNGWMYLIFRRDTSGDGYVAGFSSTNGLTWRAYFRISSSGGMLQISHGSVITNSADGLVTAGTTYHVWYNYITGSGANGISKLFLSTTSAKPVSPILEISNGNGTAPAECVLLYTATTTSIVRDKIRVSNSEIGSDPL